ncbi:MAG: double-strand break repair helicase AddA [Alphaproteobacteria bacterium]|nr:double-strand break repair helicase AddA [Alphaproteobacteria bacterium]MBP9777029.1 double-strand break repair helicase AddA [Alphaproteobacteria bacterium]
MPHQTAATSQRLAASPHHSVWVAASAGSGKTKVLTDRVLNLLLEGCPPERILCLTFTKAAAAEMANRVRARLGEWAILPESDLQRSLQILQGFTPSDEKIEQARRLFSLTLDTPGGLKIQTIHSFCQSLLKRFPLEAELSPFFEVADDTKQKFLIKEASHRVMEIPELQNSLQELIIRFSETTLRDLTDFVLQHRLFFEDSLPQDIERALNTAHVTQKGLLDSLVRGIPEQVFRNHCELLQTGGITDQARARSLIQFFTLSNSEKHQNYEDYLSLFLTQQGEKRARLLTQKLALSSPDLKDLLETEALRLEDWVQKHNALEISTVSKAFLSFSHAFLEVYEQLKKAQSLLDYDDLILKTVALLKNPGCHWVLYKLDGGLDHILVDEAQDTNPAQWQVIRTIAEEFYANAATDERHRTLFIVGDSKQSIYSFQGADPLVFTQMQTDLRTFAQRSGKTWQDVDLSVSFRSTPEILAAVDVIFSARPFSSFPLEHIPFRKEAQGHVEVWPLLQEEKDPPLEPWQLPLLHHRLDSPQKRLAQQIAGTIQKWLCENGPLAKPISPGDILILVRRRTTFVDTLIRALKEYDIPVAGIDRLWLLDGIAIQDLLKIGEFLVLPEDDLTLATVLKGPLFGLTEEDLFILARGRESTSLWQHLKNHESYKAVRGVLVDLLSRVDFLTPFALFSTILGPLEGRKKWQARLGPEVLDSLDEFLNLCLFFQQEQTPSLQKFLHWISQEVIELKRDLDQSNQVRVMTVHGSKGLQAPVVFLPDTTQIPLDTPPFEFHEKALLWLPPAAKDIFLTQKIKKKIRDKQQEEYYRLLYVALTRAEDALYICGWESNQQDTWYDFVKEGLKKIGQEIEFNDSALQGKGWRLSSVKEGEFPAVDSKKPASFLLPQWLKTPPSPEELPKILRPSQGEDEDKIESSPFGSFGTRRGILIHKLLDFLPSVEKDLRKSLAQRFLEKEVVPEEFIFEIVETALKVMNAYPELFSSLSQGEVPVVGKIGEIFLSGQIDRLIIYEDHILLVDFKTHSSVPGTLADIPHVYLKQLSLYQAALSKIYPHKPVLCGLLWTQGPRLDLIPESLLKKFIPLIDENQRWAYTEEIMA